VSHQQRRKRVGILISDRGSNMAALVAAARHSHFAAEVALVLSNRPDAEGLARAAAAGISTAFVPHSLFGGDRAAHEAAIAEQLDAAGVEIVCLAGYMRRLTSLMTERYAGRIMNIHPSLLPAFPGLDTHTRVLAAGAKLHGCTVHLVTEVVDQGPILAQAAVPVLPGDTAALLAERVLAQEHRMYPRALHLFASGQLPRPPDAQSALCNPLPCRTLGF
jgi:phosphoribosylglycinamide formyltransferase 1